MDRALKMTKGWAASALLLVLIAATSLEGVAAVEPELLVSCPLAPASCLTFGFTFPGAGSLLAVEGLDMKNGYVLWAETINNGTDGIATKLGNYKVKLVAFDDQAMANNTEYYYGQLLNVTDFLLGPYGTSLTDVANKVAHANDRLIMFANAQAEEIYNHGYPLIFGVGTSAYHYVDPAVYYLRMRGARTAALLYSKAAFTSSVAQGALNSLVASGAVLEASSVLSFAEGTLNDTTAQQYMRVIKNQDPDMFFACLLLRDAATLVNATKAIGYRPRAFFMTSAPSEPSFVEAMKKDAWYLLGPSQWQPSLGYSDQVFGSAANYAKTFRLRFNEDVSFTAAQSSAAGYVLQLGLGAADDPKNQSQVGAALHDLDTIQTFYGPVNFDTAGSNIAKPMVITQIMPPAKGAVGKVTVVAPEPYNAKRLIYPIPYVYSASSALRPFSLYALLSSFFLSSPSS
jgi:branched-chain amino acid transport system substrate-binding protein